MTNTGHTPTSFLTAEFNYCLNLTSKARKLIALLAIDLYHQEVLPEHRELQFQHLEHASDPDKAIATNVHKVCDLFYGNRTVRVPFSFGHFIARAIDQLYHRDCVSQIAQIMAGPRAHAPGSVAAIKESSKSFAKESHEAITGLLDLTSNLEQLTDSDIIAQIKETDDALRAGKVLRAELTRRLQGSALTN